MIAPIKKKKAFEKIHCPFLVKILSKPRIQRNFLNVIKVIYQKPTPNIILSA